MRITRISVSPQSENIIDIFFSENVTQPELLRAMTIAPLRSQILGNLMMVAFHDMHQEEDRQDAAAFFSGELEGFITRGLTTYDDLVSFQETLRAQIRDVNNPFLQGIGLLLHRQQRKIQPAFSRKNAALLDSLPDFDNTTVPKKLCCAIGYEIMDDPIIDPTMRDKDGNEINTEDADRFEREIFTRWISGHENKSLVTGKEIFGRPLTDRLRKAEINLFMREQLLAHGMHLIISDLYFKMEAVDETQCKFIFMQGDKKILTTASLTKEISEEIITAAQNLSDLKELLRKHIGEDASLNVISAIEAVEAKDSQSAALDVTDHNEMRTRQIPQELRHPIWLEAMMVNMMLNVPFLANIFHPDDFAQQAQEPQRALTRFEQVRNTIVGIALLTNILQGFLAATRYAPYVIPNIPLTYTTALEEKFRENPFIFSMHLLLTAVMMAGYAAILVGQVREKIPHAQNFLATTRDRAYAFWNEIRGENNPVRHDVLDEIRDALADRPVINHEGNLVLR